VPAPGETVESGPVLATGPVPDGVPGVVVFEFADVGATPFGDVGVVVPEENASRLKLGPGIPERSWCAAVRSATVP
jgi:hypothetical protein